MSEDVGRVPDGTGLSSATPIEPASPSRPEASIPSRVDPVVGHKTMADGSHVPLLKSEADTLWADAVAAKAKRESDMPTEQDAINALWSAYQRLKELGWNDAIYCPKDGSQFDVIEAGSTGIFPCRYQGEWPDGHWWIEDGGDLCPSRPVLYRRTEAEKAKLAELGRRFRRDSDASLAEDAATRLSPVGVAARAEGIAQPPTKEPTP